MSLAFIFCHVYREVNATRSYLVMTKEPQVKEMKSQAKSVSFLINFKNRMNRARLKIGLKDRSGVGISVAIVIIITRWALPTITDPELNISKNKAAPMICLS